ncbi:MAG: gfo/Idh/MocA family oxidoreductase, partial [Clostridia bacterium]|nr:gfo/Idh/MocA family oxidoreductase [Clostridia bacterium]
ITTTGDYPGSNRFEIQGTKGQLICDSHHGKGLELIVLGEDEREFCKTSEDGFGRPVKAEHITEVETDGENPQHPAILANFAAYMLGKEELFVDGKEGLKGVMLMDAMLYSGFIGKEVSLPFDDEAFYVEHQKRVATGCIKQVESKILDTSGSYGSK